MVKVTQISNPPYQSCTYVVQHGTSRQAVVIDPGSRDISTLCQCIDRLGIKTVSYIFLTHEHFDHIAGVAAARARHQARVVCSAACADRLGDPKRNLSHYFEGGHAVVLTPDLTWEEVRWQLDWDGLPVRALPTPGHSPGGVCLAIGGAVFTGDTLMGNRKTPSNLPGGNKVDLRDSLERILAEFPSDTIAYPGHGSPFSMREVVPDTVLGSLGR